MKHLPAEFSLDIALECLSFVELSYDYYKNKKLPQSLPADYKLVGEVISYENDQLERWGLLCHSERENRQVLFLRGTEGDIEWFEDIAESNQTLTKHLPVPCRVHEGFHNIFDSLYWRNTEGEILHNVLDGPISDQFCNSEWIITGHSLGAPLAMFVSLHVSFNKWCNSAPHLYSFASPRVGDEAFRKLVDESEIKNFRIANKWDIVPHFPPRSFLDPFDFKEFLYRHCGKEILINGGVSLSIAHNHSLKAYRKGLESLTGSPK